jgi:hypothetical protein
MVRENTATRNAYQVTSLFLRLNGSRGWFPSNYVEVIEEYANAMVVELTTTNYDTPKQQQQQDLGHQQSLYGVRV